MFKQGDFPKTTVTVTLKDGTVLTKTITYTKGHPQNNTTLEEEYQLFRRITSPIIGEENAEAFIRAIDRLEDVENIGDIAKYLVRK